MLRIFTNNSTYGQRLIRLRDFYISRFWRLAPAFSVVLVISSVLIFLLGSPSDHARFARQGIASLLLIGNIGAYKYSGNYFSPNPNALVHTWSLSVEEQIYLFVPILLILLILNSKKNRRITSLAFLSLTLISFISFLNPGILQPIYSKIGLPYSQVSFAFYSPIDRIWQFTLGGLTFLLVDYFGGRIPNISKSLKIILVTMLILLLFIPTFSNDKIYTVLATLIGALTILMRTLDLLPEFILKGLEWLGDRSYSVYLVHMPILYVFKYSPLIVKSGGDNTFIQAGIIVASSILLGSVSHSKIENRFRRRDKTSSNFKNFGVALSICLILPMVLFLGIDRISVSSKLDPNFPIPDIVLPWAWDQNCQFYSPFPNINLEPCKYGSYFSEKSIFLIGDSHAAADSRAIIKLGKNNKMNVFIFTFQGCGFVLDNKGFSSKYSYPFLTKGCLEHNQRILNFVLTKKPAVIIWAHHSSSIMVSPNNSISRNHYNQIVMKSILQLKKLGVPLINIGSEPELEPISTWAERLLGRKTQYSRVPHEDNVFWKSVNGASYYLDTLNIYCPRNICINRSAHGWLFQDVDHLSLQGSLMLLPQLDSALKEILKNAE